MNESPLTSPSLWNELHLDYEKVIAPLFSKVAVRLIELVAPQAQSRIIDVACGPGTLALNVAPRVRQVVAVDFATSMVGLLEDKCRFAGVRNVEARVADGMALPFADAEFDAAFSSLGLFLFSDRAKGFNELFRVVKPQSKVGISSWTPADGPIEAMYRIVREVLPDLPFQKGRAPLGTEDEIAGEMSAAGFDALHIEPVTVSYSYSNVEEFWAENSRASGPLVATRRRVAAADWPGVEARILDTLCASFPAGVRYDRDAWVAVGRRPAG
jgi:SAM-dependent methyltransferase